MTLQWTEIVLFLVCSFPIVIYIFIGAAIGPIFLSISDIPPFTATVFGELDFGAKIERPHNCSCKIDGMRSDALIMCYWVIDCVRGHTITRT